MLTRTLRRCLIASLAIALLVPRPVRAVRVADTRARGVPDGVGVVTVTSPSSARITVSWTPVNSRGAANAAHRYSTDVVIP